MRKGLYDQILKNNLFGKIAIIGLIAFFFVASTNFTYATSQWSRKTGMACNYCHTVFPRLNLAGDQFLKNGYVLGKPDKKDYSINAGGVSLSDVSQLFGFRLNVTPFMYATNSFLQDSGKDKSGLLTIGNPNWIQFFVAGSIYNNISFFTELEYASGGFKFNWFYFNFTNLLSTSYLNLQVGNISPLEFASYPNRLPQLPAIKGEVFLKKSSNGGGETSVDMSSARPGLQYFGYNDYGTLYLGASPVIIKNSLALTQFQNFWGGLVLNVPESISKDLEGSTVTLHYYTGTDTKNTGVTVPDKAQIENKFTRISPQLNIRYRNMFDLQAAYVMAEDENWDLAATKPADKFKYSGLAVEAGFMPNDEWHFALHYDKFNSDDKVAATGKYIFEYQRVVPVITYIINQNIRMSLYYEKELSDKDAKELIDRISMNMRVMF
ncbi:MAG: hypothetical protein HW421_1354 [Ignavibacteria bacterium]|nr:hypothetical protein [Ignavibacteria bacterium]